MQHFKIQLKPTYLEESNIKELSDFIFSWKLDYRK